MLQESLLKFYNDFIEYKFWNHKYIDVKLNALTNFVHLVLHSHSAVILVVHLARHRGTSWR